MLLHSGSGQDILIRESFHLRVPFGNVFALAIFSLDIGSMQNGGKILGEGVAGCVLTAPSWPCVKGSSDAPSVSDPSAVSKIVPSSDTESRYLKAAARILGPEVSKRYLAGLLGECSPANATHPPNEINAAALKVDTEAVVKSNTSGACKKLKQALISKKGITEDHTLMFISRYPMTLEEWAISLKPMTQANLASLLHAIPTFLSVLQRLVQDQNEQLVHIDLHSNNIFVRALQNNKQIELGISDFGQCFTRDYSKPATSIEFFGGYLCNFVAKYSYYYGYRQVPLEARLLNFCFKRNADTLDLREFVSLWLKDCLPHQKGDFDIVMMNLVKFTTYLMKKKLFIEMLDQIQSISKKMRLYPNSPSQLTQTLTSLEKVVLSYIMTRYTVVYPINSILEISLIITNNTKPPLTDSMEIKTISEFLRRAIMAPYDQDGSSLSGALTAIQDADMGVVWSDVLFSMGR